MESEDLDKELKNLWNETPKIQDPKLKETSWESFSAKAFPKEDRSRKLWSGSRQWAAAAAIAIILGIGTLLFYQKSSLNQLNNFQLVENTTSQVKRVLLSDGSVVELEPYAKLEYALNFKENRKIKLNGDAFFQVEKDKDHPFTVQCANTTTTVLGTSFVVQQKEDKTVSVRLYQGSVRMNVKGNVESWVLKPGEEFVFNSDRVVINSFERFMDFENSSLGEVLSYIRSNYNYRFIMPEELLEQSITLRINKKERFVTVVQIMAQMYNLKPEIDQKTRTVKFQY